MYHSILRGEKGSSKDTLTPFFRKETILLTLHLPHTAVSKHIIERSGSWTLPRWDFRFPSHSFRLLENPCFPSLEEFAPAHVGVSVPVFFILIFASGGISSGSLSSLKAAAGERVFGATVGMVSSGLLDPARTDVAAAFLVVWLPVANPGLEISVGFVGSCFSGSLLSAVTGTLPAVALGAPAHCCFIGFSPAFPKNHHFRCCRDWKLLINSNKILFINRHT